eukprot:1437037-Prymnesium_polylepis.1
MSACRAIRDAARIARMTSWPELWDDARSDSSGVGKRMSAAIGVTRGGASRDQGARAVLPLLLLLKLTTCLHVARIS